MKPIPHFELHSDKILLNPAAVQHLERLYQTLETLHLGGTLADGNLLGEDLASLAGMFDEAPDANAETHWSAEYTPHFSGNGGTLNLKEQAGCQNMAVSRDRNDTLYDGIWMRLDESNPAILMFNVASTATGYQLIIGGDEKERRIVLEGNLAGIKWASPADVINYVPEWLASSAQALMATAHPPSTPPAPPERATDFYLVNKATQASFAMTGRLIIGRGSDSDLQLKDNFLSRHHALLEPVQDGWQISDLNSTNGIKINGTRINAPVLLKPGDEITLGTIHLTLEMH